MDASTIKLVVSLVALAFSVGAVCVGIGVNLAKLRGVKTRQDALERKMENDYVRKETWDERSSADKAMHGLLRGQVEKLAAALHGKRNGQG